MSDQHMNYEPEVIVKKKGGLLGKLIALLLGIIIGIIGIVMLLFLIPMCVGLKDSKKDNQ